jgi:hypothetical protein
MLLTGPAFKNRFWNLALSCGVNGGMGPAGGGDLNAEVPVLCEATVVKPSMIARGPAEEDVYILHDDHDTITAHVY